MTMKRYHVRTLDVWGNEEDGWQVNDVFPNGYIDVEEGVTDEEIWTVLCADNAAQGPFSEAEFDWSGELTLYINEKATGKPVFELEEVLK